MVVRLLRVLVPVLLILTSQSFADTKRYIVRFRSTLPSQLSATFIPLTIKEAHTNKILSYTKSGKRLFNGKSVVLKLESHELRELLQSGYVSSFEEDKKLKIHDLPSDPNFSAGDLWGLNGTHGINAPGAWQYSTGSGVTVAEIDTGVDYRHPDLSDNVLSGYDFANDDSDPLDDNGHGTHVAGIIAGVGNNGTGIIGTAYNAHIIPLKALDGDGSGYISDVSDAVNYVVALKDAGQDITAVSMSLGGGYSKELDYAIEVAKTRGILFLVAAGNESNNNDDLSNASYPASLPYENVVSVAATDSDGEFAYFSNYGRTSVDLGAPGVGILSTVPDSVYEELSGTSMATPFVAGVVALMKSVNNDLSASQLRSALLSSVTKLSSLHGLTVTGGLLNAEASVVSVLNVSKKGQVFGKVYSKTHKGVAGTSVKIRSNSGYSSSTRTARDGAFLFDALNDGVYSLVVSKKGYRFKIRKKSVELPAESSSEVEFTGQSLKSSSR